MPAEHFLHFEKVWKVQTPHTYKCILQFHTMYMEYIT